MFLPCQGLFLNDILLLAWYFCSRITWVWKVKSNVSVWSDILTYLLLQHSTKRFFFNYKLFRLSNNQVLFWQNFITLTFIDKTEIYILKVSDLQIFFFYINSIVHYICYFVSPENFIILSKNFFFQQRTF